MRMFLKILMFFMMLGMVSGVYAARIETEPIEFQQGISVTGGIIEGDGSGITNLPNTGSGTVTNESFVMACASYFFPSGASIITTNNINSGSATIYGGFSVVGDNWSDIYTVYPGSGWNGLLAFGGTAYTDGETGLTFRAAIWVRDHNEEPLGVVTGSINTIIAGSALTNQQWVGETLDVSGSVSTNVNSFTIQYTILSTNTATDTTRTGTMIQKETQISVVK